jgi:predicted O-methyltransferase YrrM
MSEKDLGREIDDYILGLFASHYDENALFEEVLANMARNDLPSINVSANEGRLLALLTKLSGAKKVLEVGTLGAYSTIWMARALPVDGTILTLEYEPKHARVARENLEQAGLSAKVEVRVGSASETLPLIAANGEGPFDLFFIDADKNNYPLYLEWALKLAHSGSIILSDNLIRNGAVINPDPKSADAVAIARYNQELATNPRLESVIVPIIRNNTDGLGISIVK